MVDIASIAAGASAFGDIASGIGAISGLFGGGGGLSPRKAAALQYEYQARILQNQLQWRVQDAKAAGIHPLYAIGAPTVSFSPSVVGGEDPSFSDRLQNMGAGVSRAAAAFKSSPERALTTKMAALQVENQELQNTRLKSEIVLMNQPGTPPGFGNPQVVAGSGDSGVAQYNPSEIISRHPSNPGNVAGNPKPSAMVVQNLDGSTVILPSPDVTEALEAGGEVLGLLYGSEQFYHNRIAPWMQNQAKHAVRAYKKTWWNPNRR